MAWCWIWLQNTLVCFTVTDLPAKPPKPWAEPQALTECGSAQPKHVHCVLLGIGTLAQKAASSPGCASCPPWIFLGAVGHQKQQRKFWKVLSSHFPIHGPSARLRSWVTAGERGEYKSSRGSSEHAQAQQEPKRHHINMLWKDTPVLGVHILSVSVIRTERSSGETAAIPEVTLGLWKACAVPPSWCWAAFLDVFICLFVWYKHVNTWLSQVLEHGTLAF